MQSNQNINHLSLLSHTSNRELPHESSSWPHIKCLYLYMEKYDRRTICISLLKHHSFADVQTNNLTQYIHQAGLYKYCMKERHIPL